MILKSEVLTQASGSVGGIVYGRSHGRITRRARTVPTDPQSQNQRAHRALVAKLASAWTNDTTDGNRKTWSAYALGVPIPDKLGNDQLVSGRMMFMRCNAPRVQAGLAIVLAGPALNGRDDFHTPDFVSPAGGPSLVWLIDASDAWGNEDFGALNFQTSHFLSPAINFFNGPWRFLTAILGSQFGTPGLLLSQTNAFGQANARSIAGQKFAVRYTSIRADGRISSPREILYTLT